MAEYQRLWEQLGTDQIIWCYTRRENFKRTGPSLKLAEWALDVPTSAILACIDNTVWARLIGSPQFAPPRTLDTAWHTEALRASPYDSSSRKKFLELKHAAYWKEPPPEGGWWSKLLVPTSVSETVDAILQHPIDPKWRVPIRTGIHNRSSRRTRAATPRSY